MYPNRPRRSNERRVTPRTPCRFDPAIATEGFRPTTEKNDVLQRINKGKVLTLDKHEFRIWAEYSYNPSVGYLVSPRHFNIDRSDAEEIVSDAQYDLWKKLQKRDTEIYVPAYFHAILKKKACAHLWELTKAGQRKHGTPYEHRQSFDKTPEEMIVDPNNDIVGTVLSEDLNKRVATPLTSILEEIIAAVKCLPDKPHRLLWFVFVQRLRPTEIGEFYGWSRANFTNRKNAALEKLRPIIMERADWFRDPCCDLNFILETELYEYKNPLNDFEYEQGASLTLPMAAFVRELASTFHHLRKR